MPRFEPFIEYWVSWAIIKLNRPMAWFQHFFNDGRTGRINFKPKGN